MLHSHIHPTKAMPTPRRCFCLREFTRFLPVVLAASDFDLYAIPREFRETSALAPPFFIH
jgi:hypothetical protein